MAPSDRVSRPTARRFLLAATLVLSFAAAACGDESPSSSANETPAEEESSGTTSVVVTATEYEFDMPAELPAGPAEFTLVNAGQEKHFLTIVKLTDDAPEVEDLIELKEQELAKYFDGQPYEIHKVNPGETSSELTIDLLPGRYGYVCFVETKDGTPHAFLGMHGEFIVP